jgi:uncharacterized protein YndB with AHSA1/START domain
MTAASQVVTDIPVRKTILVKTSVERAFNIFTDGFDTWWPRTHHIGQSPMQQAVIESWVGGRCYTRCVDGSNCPWGTITAWEPPHRFVFAWQITPEWKYQPDLAQSSEVEVRFTAEGAGATRVDLEHRHFHRHGAGADAMRNGVDAPNGWVGLLKLYGEQVEKETA